jgi:hypothetical protein
MSQNSVSKLLGKKLPQINMSNIWIKQSPSPSPEKKKIPSPAKPKQMSPNRASKAIALLYKFKAKQKGIVYTNKGNIFGPNKKYGFALSKPEVYWSTTSTKFDKEINLADFAKTPHTAMYAVTEVTGYRSTRDRHTFRETLGTAAIGKIDSTTSYIKLNLTMLSPSQTAAVVITRGGKVTISSSGPWERVVRILFPGHIRALIANAKRTTTMSRFYCNHTIDIKFIFERIFQSNSNDMNVNQADVFMHEELPTAAHGIAFHQTGMAPAPVPKSTKGFKSKVGIVFKKPAVKLNIFKNGTITAVCEDPVDGPKAFKKLVKYIDSKDSSISELIFSNTRSAPASVRTTENLRQQKINTRYPLANSWNAVKSGFYVRPGPNGKPRFYEIPSNTTLVRTKVLRAYANAKVNIPARVKTALGITNTTVKNKVNKPSGFGNQSRNGYYAKPNKQGKPAWYKVPSGKAAAKGGVIQAYKQHSINIPAHIRTMFKISNANIAGFKVKEPKLAVSPKGTVRLNGKQLARFNKNALLEVARNLNIAAVSEKNNKDTIIAFIRGKLGK